MSNYDNQNIFAKILRGDIPCEKIYEDEYVLSFKDVNPQAQSHIPVSYTHLTLPTILLE